MPQRTRHQKMEASKRHQFRLVFNETGATPSAAPKENPIITVQEEEISPLKKYFTADLRKSLFFIVVIFALEFFLYFVRIGNHIR